MEIFLVLSVTFRNIRHHGTALVPDGEGRADLRVCLCLASPRWVAAAPHASSGHSSRQVCALACFTSSFLFLNRYVCSLSLFHYSEYLVTAVNNPKSLSLDSFLLNHSLEYTVAALSSWIEFTLENIFWPGWCGREGRVAPRG